MATRLLYSGNAATAARMVIAGTSLANLVALTPESGLPVKMADSDGCLFVGVDETRWNFSSGEFILISLLRALSYDSPRASQIVTEAHLARLDVKTAAVCRDAMALIDGQQRTA